MKNILYTIILSFLFSSHVFADFEAGMDAYEIGHYKTAYKEFRSAAEQGDPAAQFHLGQMYTEGKGVTRDYKEAAKWSRTTDLRITNGKVYYLPNCSLLFSSFLTGSGNG